MLLIDTSVWIGYLRQQDTLPVRWFQEILDRGYPFGLTSVIYQEVLQGADSEASLARLEAYLETQSFYHPRDPVDSYKEAARLYARCRRSGITIRSTIDCLIAQTAIEHELLLVHDDRDFDHLASIAPELQLYAGGLSAAASQEVHEPRSPYDR